MDRTVAAQQASGGAALAHVPQAVPEMPRGYVRRAAVIDGLKRTLLSTDDEADAAAGDGSCDKAAAEADCSGLRACDASVCTAAARTRWAVP